MSSTAVARHRAIAPAKATAAAPARRHSGLHRVAHLLSNLATLACLVAFLGLAVGPHVFGYRTATMLTGSMSPGIDPGDMVVTAPKPTSDLKIGDVISYQIPVEDHRVETHRVTRITTRADGLIQIQTKGDANEGVDPWTAVLSSDTVFEVKTVIPKAGSVIRVLSAPVIRHGILWLGVGGVLLLGLRSIWTTKSVGTDEDERGKGS